MHQNYCLKVLLSNTQTKKKEGLGFSLYPKNYPVIYMFSKFLCCCQRSGKKHKCPWVTPVPVRPNIISLSAGSTASTNAASEIWRKQYKGKRLRPLPLPLNTSKQHSGDFFHCFPGTELHPGNNGATVYPRGLAQQESWPPLLHWLVYPVRRRIHVRYLTSKCFLSSKLSVVLGSVEERLSRVEKDMTEQLLLS